MDTRKIILYPKYFEMAEDLTDTQLGTVIRAIGSFFVNGDEKLANELSLPEKILYKTMKIEIDANLKKYESTCAKRSAAAKKRAKKQKEIEQLHTIADNCG